MATLLLLTAGCSSTTTAKNPPAEVREVRPAEPADPERRAAVRMELAGAYYERGQFSVALDEVQRALAAKPDMPGAHDLRGLIYGALGDSEQAEKSFRRAQQLAPREGGTMHNYGWFLCQQRRYAEAETQFSAALAQPTYRDAVRTLLTQGVCQARAGRWADAERTLSRSFELDSGNPTTAYNLAEVLLQRGELERARFYVGRINAVDRLTTAQSLFLAARVERRLGNVGALQDLGRRLAERFPQSAEAARFERGRFDE